MRMLSHENHGDIFYVKNMVDNFTPNFLFDFNSNKFHETRQELPIFLHCQ